VNDCSECCDRMLTNDCAQTAPHKIPIRQKGISLYVSHMTNKPPSFARVNICDVSVVGSSLCSQEQLMYIREGFQLDVRSDARDTEEPRSIVL